MAEVVGSTDNSNNALPLADLPPAALQAIYHHVTGKTENMSQFFEGNVLIRSADIDRLHQMVLDQIATHHVDFGPTVTVEVKHSNERSFHHSSWSHFKSVITTSNEVTSEITLKFEFVLNLQNTIGPQRCSISVLLDSALPLLNDADHSETRAWGYWALVSRKWPTARVSIDFVDFMVARGFNNVVEEWFKSLEKSPTPELNQNIFDRYKVFAAIFDQMGRVGFAIFLSLFVFLKGTDLTLSQAAYAVCVGFVIWAIYLSARTSVLDKILKRITANIVPSVILLSDTDSRCFSKINDSMSSTRGTIIGMIGSLSISITINLLSSYAYSYFTGK